MARYQMLPGMGSHYLRQDGKMVRVNPGDIIDVDEYELRNARDKFVLLDPPPPEPEPTRGLFAVHVGGGRYDVINTVTGKPINDTRVSKAEAQAMVDEGLEEKPHETILEVEGDDASRDNGQAAAEAKAGKA